MTNEEVYQTTVEILKDTLSDYKKDGKRKSITIWVLIGILACFCAFSVFMMYLTSESAQQRIVDFMGEYEIVYEYSYEQSAIIDGEGNIVTDSNVIYPND